MTHETPLNSARPASWLRDLMWIVLAASVVFFTNLGGPHLWDEDEPKNASCGWEMMDRGDWIVPYFNGELRTDKPVLLYWFMMSAYSLLGVSEFSARLASVCCSLGTVMLTYVIGRTIFSPGAGRWSALALSCGLMFVVVSRAATPDATLIVFTTLSLTAFAVGNTGRWQTEEGAKDATRLSLAPSFKTALGMYTAMSIAVLAKGPVGILLPTASIGLFLMSRGEGLRGGVQNAIAGGGFRELIRRFTPAAFFRTVWKLRPLTALVLLCTIALPWYIAVGVRTEGAWLTGFLGNHNVGRFVNSMEGHRGPFFYYIIAVMVGFLPFSIFLPLGSWQTIQRVRRRDAWSNGSLLVTCWAGLYLVFFSMARTKLPNYVLPAYPVIALVAGAFFDRWLSAPEKLSRNWLAAAMGGLTLMGIGLAIGLPVLAGQLLPGDAVLGWLGALPILGAGVFLVLLYRDRPHAAALAFAFTAIAIPTSLFGFGALRINHHQNSAPLVALSHQARPEGVRLGTFRHWQPALVFYSRQQVGRFTDTAQVEKFFAESPDGLLITRTEHLEEVRAALPADIVEIGRMQWFLHKQEIVMLARPQGLKVASKPLRAVMAQGNSRVEKR